MTGWIDQTETSLALAKGEAIRQVKRALNLAEIELPDASQTIMIKREKDVMKRTQQKDVIGTVAPETEADLALIVETDRGDKDAEDLLNEGAQKE